MEQLSRFQVSPSSTPEGWFVFYFVASFAELQAAFGEPHDTNDKYKVSTSWVFEDVIDGSVIEVYDWKETNLYSPDLESVAKFRARPSYLWHVGATDKLDGEAFAKFLSDKLGRRVTVEKYSVGGY